MDYEKSFLDYCEKTIWKDDTEENVIKGLSLKAYNDMKKNKTKNKVVYRICGQSGSGKTTQLLYGVNEFIKYKNLDFVVVAVRNFCVYDPRYNELLQKYGKSEIREKTNGFALKLLCCTLCQFIKNGYAVVMDITLLDQEFEEILYKLLKENDYNIQYMIMSVPKIQSDNFIQKRKLESKSESSRVVYTKSADFFYDVLPKSLRYLSNIDKDSLISVWSAYDLNPVYYGKIKNCYKSFIETRKKICNCIESEEDLREAKRQFFIKNL